MSGWIKINENWDVQVQPEQIHIFPKNKEGESMRVTIKRVWLNLCYRNPKTEEVVGIQFKHYQHQRNTYWADMRKSTTSKQVSVSVIRDELARMLFKGNKVKAKQLIAIVESRL